jgi:hypothetical protein
MTKTTAAVLVAAMAVVGCGGDDTSGDDTSGDDYDFRDTCEDARDAFGELGCGSSSEDLCQRDVDWLTVTDGICHDDLLDWWLCLENQVICEHSCDPEPSLACVAAFCEANPDNAACTSCLFGCAPPRVARRSVPASEVWELQQQLARKLGPASGR